MTGKFSAYAIALACVTGAAPALAQEGIVTDADRQADRGQVIATVGSTRSSTRWPLVAGQSADQNFGDDSDERQRHSGHQAPAAQRAGDRRVAFRRRTWLVT